MNLGGDQATDGVSKILQEDDDDAVDPHLERIKNEAGGDESDEEVSLCQYICCQIPVAIYALRY